ncbi:toxin glutamine deamidase domain-containing protein [Kitasatospora sp. NPDC051853]|uniref:toxin glutamine deamidase domain-containing protein n=1 Tax=Kitasatospora sp. NPDC051853 TaxID=3364058 RepID=UPI0037B2902F
MSRNVPEELVPVLARLGHQWPQADEEGLRRAAGVWREFGAEADRLGRRGGDSVQRVTGENRGRAVDAFAEHWRGFAGGGRGSLDDAHGAAELLAGAFERAARAVDSCKAEIIAVLTELAEEIKLAEKVEAAAQAVLGKIGGAVADAVVGVGEKVAVELARHKVGNLLEELGREMKEGLQQALKEPAVTTLERIAQADGYQPVRAASAAGGAAAAGALLGGRAVAKVRGLSAVVGQDGQVVKDQQGRPVLVDESGRRVEGVANVAVQVGEDGKPLVGPDGKVAVVGEDGKPVVGVACGSDGKPLRDSNGALVVVGAGGLIAVAGVTVALGRDGKPVTGTDGEVVVLDREGRPVRGSDGHTAKVDGSGELVTDRTGHVVMVDDQGRTAGPDAHGNKKPGAGIGLDLGGLGADVQVGPGGLDVDVRAGGNGHGQDDGHGNGQGSGRGGVQVQVGPVSAGAGSYDSRYDDPYDRTTQGQSHQQDPYRQGGGSGSTQPRTVVSVDVGPGDRAGGYDRYEDDRYEDRPLHRAAGTLRTDSVAVAPPQSGLSSAFGDGPSAGTGWGRHEPSVPGASGGHGGSGASGGSFGSGGASGGLGPVGGQSALGTPPMGMGAQPAPAAPTAPVTAAPAAGAAAGAAAPPAAGAPAAGGAAGAAAVAPPGAAAAGAPGAGGQAGAAGAVGAVAGPQQPGAAAPRAAQPVGLVPNPVPAPAAPAPPAAGAVVVGPVAGRTFDLPPVLRREDESAASLAQAAPLAAMFLLLHDYRRTAPEQPGERPRPRTIADGRPYGAAGGLGPVDPAHQAEVERRVPRTEEGEPATPADPRLGDWPEALNGGGFREPGRSNNALDLSLSALDSYLGNPTCGAPRLPDGPAGEYGGRDRAERELGTQFKDLGYGDPALGQLADLLRQLGTGAQAVLLTLDGYGRSHLWNAFVAGATISYLDPQTGYRSSAPLHPADHGLWAIALEAGGRPADLSALQPAIPAVELTPAPAPDPLVKPVPVPETPAPPRSRLTIHRGSTR